MKLMNSSDIYSERQWRISYEDDNYNQSSLRLCIKSHRGYKMFSYQVGLINKIEKLLQGKVDSSLKICKNRFNK